MLDFFGPALDQGAAFATSRAATVLTQATLSKGAADNLLPQDTHYDVARLQRLFCRPRAVVSVSLIFDPIRFPNSALATHCMHAHLILTSCSPHFSPGGCPS
jgi:hypothetical protein